MEKSAFTPKTDLASEMHEYLAKRRSGKLDGLVCEKYRVGELDVTEVTVLDESGASLIGKPCGRYLTADIGRIGDVHSERFRKRCEALAEVFAKILPPEGSCLFAGLGNRRITSDATGPAAADSFIATRHLRSAEEALFKALSLRETMCVVPDVLGNTGLEAAELLCGIAEKVKPDFAVVADSLATSSLARLASTVQICDSGISPGSGVNNRRCAINSDTVGVPVIAVGVPTVADLYAVFDDFYSSAVGTDEVCRTEKSGLPPESARFVTPKDADSMIRTTSRLISYSLNLALNPSLSFDDMRELIG